jgi:hypothetical protein
VIVKGKGGGGRCITKSRSILSISRENLLLVVKEYYLS